MKSRSSLLPSQCWQARSRPASSSSTPAPSANDGVAHVALISRNNDQLAEELLAEQDKTLQEIYFPETLTEDGENEGTDATGDPASAEDSGENTQSTPTSNTPESGE